MKAYHFTIPSLPPEPLWEVPVEPTPGYRDGTFRIRARTAQHAAERARTFMGLTPTGPATRINPEEES